MHFYEQVKIHRWNAVESLEGKMPPAPPVGTNISLVRDDTKHGRDIAFTGAGAPRECLHEWRRGRRISMSLPTYRPVAASIQLLSPQQNLWLPFWDTLPPAHIIPQLCHSHRCFTEKFHVDNRSTLMLLKWLIFTIYSKPIYGNKLRLGLSWTW